MGPAAACQDNTAEAAERGQLREAAHEPPPTSVNGTPFTLLSRPRALDFSMHIFYIV